MMFDRPLTTPVPPSLLSQIRYQNPAARRDSKNAGASGDVYENKQGNFKEQVSAPPVCGGWLAGKPAKARSSSRTPNVFRLGRGRAPGVDQHSKMQVHPAMCMKTNRGILKNRFQRRRCAAGG
jgi:hypothetical protein